MGPCLRVPPIRLGGLASGEGKSSFGASLRNRSVSSPSVVDDRRGRRVGFPRGQYRAATEHFAPFCGRCASIWRPRRFPPSSRPPSAQQHPPLPYILHLPPWDNLQVMDQQVSAKVHLRRNSRVGGRRRGRPPQAGTSREQPRSPNPAASTICTPCERLCSLKSCHSTSSRNFASDPGITRGFPSWAQLRGNMFLARLPAGGCTFISHKVFLKSFCKSQLPNESVN